MNQGNDSDAPPGIPPKRKRGRPRKDPSLGCLAIARPPPGFEALNGNQSRHVDPIEDSNDGVVGQAVTGVVEAAFDAGYLLAVKIGNSNTSLRGVIFKPGRYTPVTAENDVAPHLQMIRRSGIHFPTGQTHGRSRERNDQHISYLGNGSPLSNQVHRIAPRTGTLVTPKGKYASAIVPASSVPPVGARGTVVPVVLQPVNLSNGVNQVTSAASHADEMMALKGKHVQTVTPISTYPPNGSTGTDQGLGSTNRALSQSQTSAQVTPTSVKSENGPFNQGTAELRQGEAGKSMKSTEMFTPGEVMKGVEGSSQSSEPEERDSSDMSEPLFIEPLQTIHTHPYNLSASIPRAVDSNRTGRMTELLLAVQENMPENHFPRASLPVSGSNISFHQPRSTETDIGDENCYQASNS